ncbi:MAG: LacI family transcriptional regulator [Spirochaetaceae bacterium]|jgi:DNA-binding LacI/PurR family transcriptional regulator|nr:LacI family transcriptional regulator [Spirochaetaceae bacterium]
MATLKDIAEQAGVSASTVSRVLHSKEYINPEKRTQILKLLEQNSYILPEKPVQNAETRKAITIGILISDTYNMYRRQFFSSIERYLNSFGYRALFFFVKFDIASQKESLEHLKSEKLDGIILHNELSLPAFTDYITKRNIQAVSTICNDDPFPTIKIDDRRAAAEAVNHLISLGHRNINLLYGNAFSYGRERMEGYYEALAGAGIERDENRIFSVGRYTCEAGMYGMREMLLRRRDFTALFAASDDLAIGAIRVLQDEGIRVPEEVSVISVDDVEIANYFIPRLTTIHQPMDEIAEQSVINLRRLMSGGNGINSEIIIPHKLIVRESTSAIVH